MSTALTRNVRVEVKSFYVPEQSQPEANHYFFAYNITISNVGGDAVQLLKRHWIITDANGQVEEVQGDGVVGEQPVLQSGQSFNYTSFCPLKTTFGTMHGTYLMTSSKGESFEAEIAPFKLVKDDVVLH